jgi:1-deoxy-D-xylulose-5-phosphate reductoisomerase
MRLPIQYALTFPERLPSPARAASPEAWGSLEFAPLAPGAYPAYDVVRAAAADGGNRGTILNAADEVGVEAFLAGRIPFSRIAKLIDDAVDRWGGTAEPELDDIAALDGEVRATVRADVGLEGAA